MGTVTNLANFELGRIYRFKRNEKIFIGKYVYRSYGLGYAFTGRVIGETERCDLPLKSVFTHNWKLINETDTGM